MAEAKPFASLSSGLLARKGAARPAMRPQGFGQAGAGLEDLGWNDMGFEAPKPAIAPRDDAHDAFGDDVVEHPRAHPTGLTPVQSPVHSQQAEIADRFLSDEGEDEVEQTAEIFAPQVVATAPVKKPMALSAPEPEPELEAAVEIEEPVSFVSEAVPPVIHEPEIVADPVPVAVTERPAPHRSPRVRSAPGGKGKAAFTLRLDPDRHLKLRLACAIDGRSAQQLVTDALDQLLDRMPELEAMAAKAKPKG